MLLTARILVSLHLWQTNHCCVNIQSFKIPLKQLLGPFQSFTQLSLLSE